MKFLVPVIIVVFIVAAGLVWFLSSNNSPQPEQTPAQTQETPQDSGRYIEYSSSTLDEDSDKRRVLFFYANWCPTCRPADANFKTNADKIPEDVVLIRVNYNDTDTDAEERALADKYGVTYQHTFVQIDENGEELTKWNGGQIEKLLANIK